MPDALGRPVRLQRSRARGWRMPEGAVYVGRPTRWGNPFRHPDPAQAVAAYRRLLQGGTRSFAIEPGGLQFARDAHPDTLHWAWLDWARLCLRDLRGRDLVCWCPLDQPCHADVLLELANPGLRCAPAST